MIDHQLELGTKIYYAHEDNNVFSRKRIMTKDKNDVEWYRYDKPLRSHSIKEYTIVGRVLARGEGIVPSIENYYDMYFTEDGVQVDQYEIDEYDNSSGYFLNEDEALEWIERRKLLCEHLERS